MMLNEWHEDKNKLVSTVAGQKKKIMQTFWNIFSKFQSIIKTKNIHIN